MQKKQKISIILVEPHYEENIGLICRVMKNFGSSELILVNPIADVTSVKARSRSMHAYDLLKKAKIVSSMNEAVKKCDIVVATTALIPQKSNITRPRYSLSDFSKKYSKFDGRIGFVFGREPTGLTNEEILKCDTLIYIPTSCEYKTLNITHAVAVILYEMFNSKKEKTGKTFALKKVKKQVLDQYSELVNSLEKVKKKDVTFNAFKSFLSKSPINDKEAKNIYHVIKSALSKIREKNKFE